MTKDLIEIRWHGRGGQGAVTAAKTLAEMVLTKDMFFQAFPEYGPERMGAPIQCFNRLSKHPISIYCGVTDPDMVAVVDPTLLEVVDVTSGLVEGGVIIVNTELSPQELREKIGKSNSWKVYTLDATKISMETLGRFMPNIPMLGAIIKITGLLTEEEASAFLKTTFGKKFPEKVVEGNVAALKRAFQEVKGE